MHQMKEYLKLECGWIWKFILHGVEKASLKFFDDYEKWCSRNNIRIDFIEPLAWHLFCIGYPRWKVNRYLSMVRTKILTEVRRQTDDKNY